MPAQLPNRRSLIAAVTGAVAAATVILRGGSFDDAAEARRRGTGRPEIEGPCGNDPKKNKCTKNKQCCTDYCDTALQRCRFKPLGEECSSNAQCRGDRQCIDNVCSLPATATPVVTPTPIPSWSWAANYGSRGTDPGQFAGISDAVLLPDQLTMATSDYSGWITFWTRNSTSTTSWNVGSRLSFPGGPNGLAFSSDGLTMIATLNSAEVGVYRRPNTSSSSWSSETTFGSSGSDPDQFDTPNFIVLSADDRTAYVADNGLNRVSIWSRSTSSSTDWTHVTNFGTSGSGDGEFNEAYGLFLTADELTLYVVDLSNSRVQIWSRPNTTGHAWAWQANFGSYGTGPSNFAYPGDIVLSDDELFAYITDRMDNKRVSIWSRSSTSNLNWSNYGSFGTGGADSDDFGDPWSICMAADQRSLYIADGGYYVQRVSIWVAS